MRIFIEKEFQFWKEIMFYWEGWTWNITTAWIEIILHGILCVLITLVLLLYFWIFICDNDIPILNRLTSGGLSIPRMSSIKSNISSDNIKKYKSHKYLKLILFGSIICGILNIYSTYWLANISILVYNMRPINGCFYRSLCVAALYLQRLLTYLFFLYRLTIAFTDSVYALSKIQLYVLVLILIIGIGCSLSVTIIGGYINSIFPCSTILVRSGFIIAGSGDIIYSILLSYIFISKLNKLVIKVNNDSVNGAIKRVMQKLTILSNYNYIYIYLYLDRNVSIL